MAHITDHVVVRMRGRSYSSDDIMSMLERVDPRLILTAITVLPKPSEGPNVKLSDQCRADMLAHGYWERDLSSMLAGLDPRLVVSVDAIASRDNAGAKGRWRRARKKLGKARNTLSQCRKKKAVARWQDKVLAYELEVAYLARCVDWPEPEVDVAWENAQDAILTGLNASRSAREAQQYL